MHTAHCAHVRRSTVRLGLGSEAREFTSKRRVPTKRRVDERKSVANPLSNLTPDSCILCRGDEDVAIVVGSDVKVVDVKVVTIQKLSRRKL